MSPPTTEPPVATPPTPALPDADAVEPSLPFRARLGHAVGSIAAGIAGGFSPGEVAALRRVGPEGWGVPAFWRVVVRILEPHGLLAHGGEARDRDELRWAVLLSAFAALDGQHARGVSLGRALASAGVSELRVERLLRAHDAALLDLVRPLARQLATKGVSFDQAGLAELVLTDGTDREDAVRRAIGRDFYRAQTSNP
jgi:CRISPR type I-E-associated protein CasB/Cse2